MLCCGVGVQVTQVFARRGYNVQSLAVGPAEAVGDSRITMVVPGTVETIEKVTGFRVLSLHWGLGRVVSGCEV